MEISNGVNLSKIIESILFVRGEPTKISRLTKLIESSEEELLSALDDLEKKLEGRGIRLVRYEDKVMLGTAPESSEYVRALMKEEYNSILSKATLETLAIVVYHGPIVRGDIDFIRGVNSSFILRNLMVRGIINRTINPKDKRTFIYKPSIQFLQHIGITKIGELPEYSDFKNSVEGFLEENIENINESR